MGFTSKFDLIIEATSNAKRIMAGVSDSFRRTATVGQQSAMQVTATWTRVTGAITAVQAAFAAVGRGMAFLEAAAKRQQQMRVFEAMVPGAEKLLRTMQAITHYTVEEDTLIAWATKAQLALNDTGKIVERLPLAMALAAAHAQDLDAVVENITKALATGELSGLKPYGAALDETGAKIKDVGSALDELERKHRNVMDAIQAEGQQEAETLRRGRAWWEDFKDTVGDVALSTVGHLAEIGDASGRAFATRDVDDFATAMQRREEAQEAAANATIATWKQVSQTLVESAERPKFMLSDLTSILREIGDTAADVLRRIAESNAVGVIAASAKTAQQAWRDAAAGMAAVLARQQEAIEAQRQAAELLWKEVRGELSVAEEIRLTQLRLQLAVLREQGVVLEDLIVRQAEYDYAKQAEADRAAGKLSPEELQAIRDAITKRTPKGGGGGASVPTPPRESQLPGLQEATRRAQIELDLVEKHISEMEAIWQRHKENIAALERQALEESERMARQGLSAEKQAELQRAIDAELAEAKKRQEIETRVELVKWAAAEEAKAADESARAQAKADRDKEAALQRKDRADRRRADAQRRAAQVEMQLADAGINAANQLAHVMTGHKRALNIIDGLTETARAAAAIARGLGGDPMGWAAAVQHTIAAAAYFKAAGAGGKASGGATGAAGASSSYEASNRFRDSLAQGGPGQGGGGSVVINVHGFAGDERKLASEVVRLHNIGTQAGYSGRSRY